MKRGVLSKEDKLDYILTGYIFFLRELHILCWKTYTSVALTELCKKHGIPEHTGIGIKKLSYILTEGSGNQLKYWWNPKNPEGRFREMAEAIYNQNKVYKLNLITKNDLPKNLKPLSTMKTADSDHVVKDTTLAKYQQVLKSLYVDLVERKTKVTNITSYIGVYKINRNIGNVLVKEGILIKGSESYSWVGKEPTLDFTKNIIILCNISANGKRDEPVIPKVKVEKVKKKRERFVSPETVQKYLTGMKLLYSTIIEGKVRITNITQYLDNLGVNKNLGSMLIKQNLITKREDGFYTWNVEEPNEAFITKLVSDWYDYIEGLKVKSKDLQGTNNTPVTTVIQEEKKIILPSIEALKSQTQLKTEIALKLIKLGQLESANNILSELTN